MALESLGPSTDPGLAIAGQEDPHPGDQGAENPIDQRAARLGRGGRRWSRSSSWPSSFGGAWTKAVLQLARSSRAPPSQAEWME